MPLMDRAERIIGIIGGAIGIVGGVFGGLSYYHDDLFPPPTFQLIGMRFVDGMQRDIHDPSLGANQREATRRTRLSFELAFRYHNNSPRFVQIESLWPRHEQVEGFDLVQCYLPNIEAAVAPGESKDLLCRTPSGAVDLEPGHEPRLAGSDLQSPVYRSWAYACALSVELEGASDGSEPSERVHFPFWYPANFGGAPCHTNLEITRRGRR